MINNKCNLIMVLLSVFALALFVAANNANAKIENSVSASANTGGNVVKNGGTITTGDAKATVKATNIVNGKNSKTETSVKAEVQGSGSTARVEVNGEEKSCTAENGGSCQVEINSTDDSASASIETENTEKIVDQEKNIVDKIVGTVASVTKSFIEGVKQWFS